jgi:hypothetical protein
MRFQRIAIPAVVAAGLAALPVSAAKAQAYYPYPCNPFPLFWPFCAAAAIVGGVGAIVTAPFRGRRRPFRAAAGPYYGYGYGYGYPPPYYRRGITAGRITGAKPALPPARRGACRHGAATIVPRQTLRDGAMRIPLYADASGQSHFRDIEVEWAEKARRQAVEAVAGDRHHLPRVQPARPRLAPGAAP